jgi:outer membrane protein insertion porin family
MKRANGAMRLVMLAAAWALPAAAVLCTAPAARAATATSITGNAAISSRHLREAAAAELRGLDDPARRRAAAADAAFQMEHAGRRAGYAFMEVEYAITGEGAEAAVAFTVREGPRVVLGEVTFPGNSFFPVAELRKRIAGEGPAPYVEADVRTGRNELLLLYRDQGFADVKIGDPQITFRADRSVADVRLEVVEGTRFVISGVVFEGDPLPGPALALQRRAAALLGQPYFERRGLALATSAAEAFAAQGYPDAAASVRRDSDPSGDVVLHVSVAGGPRVRISRVDVTGNVRTSARFILSRIPLKPGSWFDQEALQSGVRELYRTGIFSHVGHSLEGEGPERVVLVKVEEAPAREASAEVGWGSYEKLRGRVGVRDRNVFGTGRSVGAEAGLSTKSRSAKVDFLNPRFLGSEAALSVPVSWSYREEPSFNEEKVELALRLYRQFADKVTGGVKYGFTFDGVSHLSPDVPPDARDEQYTTASVKASLDVDRRNDIFYPSRGWQSALSVELADQRLGGSLDFLRCRGEGKLFAPLGAGFVLGMRLDTGFIVPTRSGHDLPVSERFFTGGDRSVRSFEEQQLGPKGSTGDPLGGLASTVAGIELRRRIAGNLAAAVFADVGNIAPNQSLGASGSQAQSTADLVEGMWKDYLSDFRAGVGFGLQYLTPLGPARLDLAWNPAPRAAEHEERFVSHFSIGMAF